MVWGRRSDAPGGAAAISDWLEKLKDNTPSFQSLTVLRFRSFDTEAVKAFSEALAGNVTLTELYASGHKLEREGIQALSAALRSNTTIQSLNVGDSSLGDDGLSILATGVAASASLRKLDLENKGITGAGVAALSRAVAEKGSTTLRHLVLSRNMISGTQLGETGPLFEALEALEACDCALDGEGLSLLCKGLASCKALTRLDLSGNPVGQGFKALGSWVATCSTLEILRLSQCRVGGDALDHLLSGLTARPLPLRVLDLSGCGLREEGSRSLATALRSASVPKRIVVSRNDIPWAGARCLLEALAERTTTACKILDLGGNPLGPESGQGVPALAVHAGVESLCLFECGVGDEGGRGLASGLAACTTLQHLDVGANGMSVETLRSLVEASCGCPSLRTLEVAANPGVQEGAFEEVVREAAGKRTDLEVVWRAAAGQGDLTDGR